MTDEGKCFVYGLCLGACAALLGCWIYLVNWHPIEQGAIQHAQGKITCELVQQPDMTTEWECERHD